MNVLIQKPCSPFCSLNNIKAHASFSIRKQLPTRKRLVTHIPGKKDHCVPLLIYFFVSLCLLQEITGSVAPDYTAQQKTKGPHFRMAAVDSSEYSLRFIEVFLFFGGSKRGTLFDCLCIWGRGRCLSLSGTCWGREGSVVLSVSVPEEDSNDLLPNCHPFIHEIWYCFHCACSQI